MHLPPVTKVLGSRLTLGHLSRLTLEQTDIEKIAVDWDRLEEGEDFQLVSPTAFFRTNPSSNLRAMRLVSILRVVQEGRHPSSDASGGGIWNRTVNQTRSRIDHVIFYGVPSPVA